MKLKLSEGDGGEGNECTEEICNMEVARKEIGRGNKMKRIEWRNMFVIEYPRFQISMQKRKESRLMHLSHRIVQYHTVLHQSRSSSIVRKRRKSSRIISSLPQNPPMHGIMEESKCRLGRQRRDGIGGAYNLINTTVP